MDNLGLVSIVTPTYNCEEFISETIKSVLVQTYPYWELLVVDDCSKDNTVAIVKEWCAKDKRIKLFVQQQNGGASLARNKAILESTGKYIAFLDGDDLWLPEKLEKQIKFMHDNNILFSYHDTYTYIQGERFSIEEMHPSRYYPKSVSYSDMLKWDMVGCLSVVFDASVIGKITIPRIDKRNDYGLFLKIFKIQKGLIGHLYDEKLAIYRRRPASISNVSKWKLVKYHYQMFHEVLEFNSLLSVVLTIRNMVYYKYYMKFNRN